MTISTAAGYVTYSGDGATTTFAIPFSFTGNSEVAVYSINKVTGGSTLQTYTTHYTISGTNVVFGTAPASTVNIALKLLPSFSQTTSFVTNGAFSAANLNTAFDTLSKQIKSVKAELDNETLKFEANALTKTLAIGSEDGSRLIAVNSAGTGLEAVTAESVLGSGINVVVASLTSDVTAPTMGGPLNTNSNNIIVNNGYGLVGTAGTNVYPTIKMKYVTSSGTYTPRLDINLDRSDASTLGVNFRAYGDTVGGSAGTAYTGASLLVPGTGQGQGGLAIYTGADTYADRCVYGNRGISFFQAASYSIGADTTLSNESGITFYTALAATYPYRSAALLNSNLLRLKSITETERDGNSYIDNGAIVYNSTSGEIEGRVGGSWVSLASTSGSVATSNSNIFTTASTTSTTFTSTTMTTSHVISGASDVIKLDAVLHVGTSAAANVDFKIVVNVAGVDTNVFGVPSGSRTSVYGRVVSAGADALTAFPITDSFTSGGTAGQTVTVTIHWKTSTGTAYLNRTGNDTDVAATPRGFSSMTTTLIRV